jgi:hypothetical protein
MGRAAISFSSISGTDGMARVGAIPAARFNSWTLLPGDAPGSFAFAASVSEADGYWITQSPNMLVLSMGTKTLVWRGVDLEIGDGRVRATLAGAPEER